MTAGLDRELTVLAGFIELNPLVDYIFITAAIAEMLQAEVFFQKIMKLVRRH